MPTTRYDYNVHQWQWISMIALTQEETDAKKLIEQIQMLYPTWDCRLLHATYDGVQCEVI